MKFTTPLSKCTLDAQRLELGPFLGNCHLLLLYNLFREPPIHNMALAALLLRSAALILLIVALHWLSQYLFASKDEPPVVHHWLPFVGSAITYGQDPYAFFFRCREKVRVVCSDFTSWLTYTIVRRCLLFRASWQEDDCLSWYSRQ